MDDIKFCCICGESLKGYGNNALPFARGACCDTCNNKYVIPYRAYLTRKQSIRAAADMLAQTQIRKHADAVLNGYIGKRVALTMWDDCVEVGVLHVDTVAVHYCTYSPADNKEIIGYYIDTGKTELHFRKSHVKKIRLAEAAETPTIKEQINALVDKSVFIEFENGGSAAGFLHKQTTTGQCGIMTRYYINTPLRHIYFEIADVKSIKEH